MEENMEKVLYIQASPRGKRSYSLAAADAFIASYQKGNPGDHVVTFDLFSKKLPSFDGFAVKAKYTILHGLKHSDEELGVWREVEAIIDEFKSADKYVFAVPMWNFGIPYRLKHYLDLLVQPTYTFEVTPDGGYRGLVTGKPVFVAYSRGGEYAEGGPAEAFDYQSKYLNMILGFIGFTDIRTLVIEPTLAKGPEVAKNKRERAIEAAADMGKAF
jgi:FMN-dependent NADH-azoreductase